MTLSVTAVQRLSKLADYMDTLKPSFRRKFNMQTWYQPEFCGTSGCAFGYSTRIEEFYNLGLRMMNGIPYFQGKTQFAAVQAFYDIDEQAAANLFGARTATFIREPKDWAFHCREYLKAHGAQPIAPTQDFKKFMGKVLATTV